MNKTLFIISLIVVLTLTGCQDTQMMANQAAREAAQEIDLDINTKIEALQLPADIVVPKTLPATIQDPVLLEGWIRLYNRTQACEMWDGSTLTGQQLAQYVINQSVVITWNTNPAYSDGSWVDRGNTDIIYINPGLKEENETQMTRLVSTLAHEIFHHATPFDQVEDTLYEEYWAHYVGSCVSGRGQVGFNYFNPLSPDSLTLWFKANNRSGYLGAYDLYPENVMPLAANN
jgi:hypothetical protein